MFDLVLLGASAGGVDVFRRFFRMLPADFPKPIVVIHHMVRDSRVDHSSVYGGKGQLAVREVEDKIQLRPGSIYFCPPDYHTLIEKDLTVSLDFSDPVHFSRPSIDVTFMSAAEELGGRVIAALFTGAGEDGAAGLDALKKEGAFTFVQNPETAEAPFMPLAALKRNPDHYIGDLTEIAQKIQSLVGCSNEK